MIKIACIGIAVQDRLYYVEKLPHDGGKYVAQDYKEIGGGPAATAAVAVAKLGAQVDFIGRLGNDAAGKTMRDELEAAGVNTSLTKMFSNARSSQSAVLVDKAGERIIINHPSPDLLVESDWMHTIDFSQYDMVLADVRWHEGAEYAFTKARAVGVPTLLDADTTPQSILPLVKLADHAVFSEPGLARMTAENDSTKALTLAAAQTSGTVYVTRGKSGCFWLEHQQLQHQAGFSVEVVDTTGAGDVFHGALAFALAEKQPITQAVRFANAVAALKCTQPGGRAGIPNRQTTDAFLSLSV